MTRGTAGGDVSALAGDGPVSSRLGPGFTAAVSAITDAFGDPTRRHIYVYLRERGGGDDARPGATAAEIAADAGVHVNVARHHLDKLVAGGYVGVTRDVSAAGARRAGRPSKRYAAVAGRAVGELNAPRDDLVLALLGRALARLPHAEAETMAEDVGATYGRALADAITGGDEVAAGHRSLQSAMQSVADALTAHGFSARTAGVEGAGNGENRLRIINDHCPFGDVAIDHPVICAVDRGLVRGMLSALYGDDPDVAVATASSRALGDATCATAV
ncbi:helix-turn-helix domain-containing protein [soil metagenome]